MRHAMGYSLDTFFRDGITPMISLLYMTTGAVIAMGFFHAFLANAGIGRKGNMAFFLTCVMGGAYALESIHMYQAETLDAYMFHLQTRMWFFALLFPLFAWFVAFYTRIWSRPWLYTVTALWVASPFLRSLSETTLIFHDINGLSFRTDFWGERLSFLDAGVSPWGFGLYGLIVATFGHVFYTAVVLHRKGRRYETGVLVLSLMAFFVTIVHDILQESLHLSTPPLGELGFLFVIGFMSLGVAREVIHVDAYRRFYVKAREDSHQAADARRASEARLRLLLESLPEIVWLTDAKGSIYLVSPSVNASLGFSTEDYAARTLADRIHPDDLSAYVGAAAQAAAGLAVRDLRVRLAHARRTWVSCEVSLSPIPAHEDQEAGVLAVFRDITDRLDLSERLRQAEKLQVVGQLASGVAHDFNNQLTGIIGFSEILRDEVGNSPEAAEALDHIFSAADASAALVRRLLMFSRKKTVADELVDVHEVIRGVEVLLRKGAATQLQVTTALAAPHATVLGDQSQIQNALLNLGVNARDATRHTQGRLHVATRVVSAGAVSGLDPSVSPYFLEISIADNGTGMDPDTAARVFEPYFTTKAEGEGTGLGLAAVWGMAASHRGVVQLQTELGVGTTFYLFFPLTDGAAQGAARPALAALPSVRGARHILVVDDEARLAHLAGELLRREGYLVEVCADAGDALKQLKSKNNRFDLAFLDLKMPSVGGTALFAQLRTQQPEVKALFTSGMYPGPEDVAQMELFGGGFLPKPYSREGLIRAICAQFHGSDGSPDGPKAGRS